MAHPFLRHFIFPSGQTWSAVVLAALLASLVLVGNACGGSSTVQLSPPPPPPMLVVNSLDDVAQPPAGTLTLRMALDQATSSEKITFAPALNGGTIELSIIGEGHSILLGEVYSGGPPTFQGYFERDYGKSALYAKKNVVLDATNLPAGITIRWTGGDANPARVLAVYGNLTLRNIAITGGYSLAEAIRGTGSQPFTLARGGGLAVWGTARLENCAVYGNKILGDDAATRDRGAYGGGIYANGLVLTNCIVSGNSAKGYGAAGGGIYSVGGADNTNGNGNDTSLSNCVITGNRATAEHAYGGGLFTLSGGPNNLATMTLTNCTVARNLAEDNPDLPEAGQWYYRGGGIYMGGGSLTVISSTIAENELNGPETMFSGKSNMGGGGVAATVGNAHVVESATLQHSIVIGNKMNGVAQDWFAGSILHFYSYGHNRIGALDFSQILVPVPEWNDLSRKHYPEPGDLDSLNPADVLDLNSIQHHASILSAGTDAGQPTVLWYSPGTAATNQIPTAAYNFDIVSAGYTGYSVSSDDFLNHLLDKLRTDYADKLGSDFGSEFGDMTGTTWYGPAKTWPSDPQNVPWITFWRNLDKAINGRLGTATLGDAFWGTYQSGRLCDYVSMTVTKKEQTVQLITSDQRGHSRPSGNLGDVGAIEK